MKKIMIAACCLLSGCATIVNGRRQDVGINSTPSGADCSVDGTMTIKTPSAVELKRKKAHVIKCEKQGYAPGGAVVTPHASGWLLGNFLLGGPIGLIVDVLTGGAWKLKPESVEVALISQPQTIQAPAPTVSQTAEPAKKTEPTKEMGK